MGQYTVVQHSGYGYNGNEGFKHAVESRLVETILEERRVTKAGGLLFNDYLKAEDYCEQANYPPGAGGIYPKAEGTFAKQQIDGLAIYIPKRLTVDEAITIYQTEKANIEAEQIKEADPPGRVRDHVAETILKVRLNEVDTFLNVLRDMKDGH